METPPPVLVLRDRHINMLKVLELQDDILARLGSKLDLPPLGISRPPRNDDDTYLAIVAMVGSLAELALRVTKDDLGALVIEVDQAWKSGIQGMPRH